MSAGCSNQPLRRFWDIMVFLISCSLVLVCGAITFRSVGLGNITHLYSGSASVTPEQLSRPFCISVARNGVPRSHQPLSRSHDTFAVMCAEIFPAIYTGPHLDELVVLRFQTQIGSGAIFAAPVGRLSRFPPIPGFSVLFCYPGLVPDSATMRDRAK